MAYVDALGASASRLLAGLEASRATVRYDIVSLRYDKDRQTAPPMRRWTDAPLDRCAAEPTDRKVLLLLNSKNRQLHTAF